MQPEDWEIWLDAQLPPILAKWINEYTGLNVKSAYLLSLTDLDDIEIYYKAKAAGKVILVSKDADFPQLISRLGAPPKLIKLNIGNCRSRVLWEVIKNYIGIAVDTLMSSDIDIVEID